MTGVDQRVVRSLTNGYLPLAALAHDDPTAIGRIELDRPIALVPPPAVERLEPARDAMALVRLHGHCLALIHLDGVPERLERRELTQHVWAATADRIREHAERFGCCPSPRSADELVAGLGEAARCQPAGPTARVSIVIPTAGRPDHLRRCLQSVRLLSWPDWEVVVVEHRPSRGQTEQVVSSFAAADDRFRYVHEPRPGFSPVARNRGIAESQGEIIAFTDDDAVVDERWLDWLVSPFADLGVGVVTGLVLPLALQTPAQKRLERYAGFSKGLEPRVYDLGEHRARDRFMYPFWGGMFGSGGNMAFRRERLLSAGGFDTALRYGSDTEAFSAEILRGARLVYEPRAVCWHEHRTDDESLRRQVFHYGAALTAALTKALLTDHRFIPAAVRSVPIAVAQRRQAAGAGEQWSAPPDLLRAQRRGMIRGPWRYLGDRRRARRLDLDRVIRGS